jgi:hypothetical protein
VSVRGGQQSGGVVAVERRVRRDIIWEPHSWPIQSGEAFPPDTFRLVLSVEHQRRDSRRKNWTRDTSHPEPLTHTILATEVTPDEMAKLIADGAEWLAYRGER